MKLIACLIGFVLLSSLIVQAASTGTVEAVGVVVDLRDGSKLIGTVTPPDLAIEVKTEALGKLSIPLNRIARAEFPKDGGPAALVLQNGDKLKGEVQLRALKLQTLLGLLTVPMEAVAKFEVRATGAGAARLLGPEDWRSIPVPRNCDWPGPWGEPSTVDDQGVHLLGHPLRAVQTYRLPLEFECEFVVPERADGDEYLVILTGPPGAAEDIYPERMIQLIVQKGTPHGNRVATQLMVYQYFGDLKHGRTIGQRSGWEVTPGEWNRLRIQMSADGWKITVNDETFAVDVAKGEQDEVLVELQNWKPATPWQLRKISIRPAAAPAR